MWKNLLLMVLLSSAANAICSQGVCQITPVESDELISNPGIGWMTFRKAASDDKSVIPPGVTSTVHYVRRSWSSIHIGDDQYDWSPIDTQIESARAGAQQYLFQIMPTNPSSIPATSGPQWMRDAGYKGFVHKHKCDSEELWVPDIDDPDVQDQVSKLLSELGKRYDNHSSVFAFEISFFGTWGEGHFSQACLPPYNSSSRVPIPSDATLEWLADEHYRNFPNTPLIGPIECSKGQILTKYMYEQYNGGIFFNCWGHYPQEPGQWSHMTDSYPQCLDFIHEGEQDSWKTGIIKLEPCKPMTDWSEANRTRALQWALDRHASLLHNQNGDVPEESLDELHETLKKLGYRLVLRSMEHPQTINKGQMLPVKLDFENIGVAPPYKDYLIALRLKNVEEFVFVSDISVKHWLPGDHIETVNAAFDVNPGIYELSVGIVQNQEPAINLAIEGKDLSGWYPLSSIEILEEPALCGDTACSGNETYLTCPEDCYHPADLNQDGCIVMTELPDFINCWKSTYAENMGCTMVTLIDALEVWKQGC